MSSLTHKYIPRVLQREENLFVEEYYSGTDTKIYIDGEEQKEVSYIQYSINEQLKPIYGYNSRTFDGIAVGNRIVTGIIKVPIANPNKQSTYEEVTTAAPSTQDQIDKYNSNEQITKDSKEWITGANGNVNSNTNNKTFEYQSKLAALGYTVTDSGIVDEATKKSIKKFQEYVGLEVTGTLNTETKSAIDEAVELSNITAKYLIADAKMYSGPAESFSSLGTLQANTKVYVIDNSFDDFVMINTVEGKTGYIRKEFIGE